MPFGLASSCFLAAAVEDSPCSSALLGAMVLNKLGTRRILRRREATLREGSLQVFPTTCPFPQAHQYECVKLQLIKYMLLHNLISVLHVLPIRADTVAAS